MKSFGGHTCFLRHSLLFIWFLSPGNSEIVYVFPLIKNASKLRINKYDVIVVVVVDVCSSQASESTRRSSHVPSETTSRLHGRDSMVGSASGRSHLTQQQQQQQQAEQRRKSSKDFIVGAAVSGSESLFSSMPPSLAAAFELPGIHISRIETLDFDDETSRPVSPSIDQLGILKAALLANTTAMSIKVRTERDRNE